MKFSTKTEYGLRAIVHLDRNRKMAKSLAEIARQEKISLKYLEKIFRILKKNNLVKSQKGVKGGYLLTKNPKQITVLDIVEILEGPVAPYACIKSKKLLCYASCKIHPVWQALYKQIIKTLKGIKLINIME